MHSDTDLVAAARAGDGRALDALVTRYEPRVYRFSYRLTGNADDAAEVAQDALMAMARSLGTFRGESSLATWLYAVARRLAIRKSKQRKARLDRETPLDRFDDASDSALRSVDPSPEEQALDHERDEAINAALAHLNASHREVLVLRDIEGLTAPEVANVLGIGVRAVKSRLHRARLRLRGELAPFVGVFEPERTKPACLHVVEQFSKSLEGELGPATCAELEKHLANCRGCRALCGSLKKVLAVCRKAPARDLPTALRRSLKQAVRQARS